MGQRAATVDANPSWNPSVNRKETVAYIAHRTPHVQRSETVARRVAGGRPKHPAWGLGMAAVNPLHPLHDRGVYARK